MASRSLLWSGVALSILAVLLLASLAVGASALPTNSFAPIAIFGIEPGISPIKQSDIKDQILSETRSAHSVEMKTIKESRAQLFLPLIEDLATNQKEPNELSQKRYLATKEGDIITVWDYSLYVRPYPELTRLADEIYKQSDSEYGFIYDVLQVINYSTDYAPDGDIEAVNTPLQTLNMSRGDCEDLTILVASIIKSSSYTQDWEMKLVYLNSKDPNNANGVNHVALFVDTGQMATFVESTSKANGLHVWDSIEGWYLDI